MIDDIEIDAGAQSGSAPVANFTANPTNVNVGGTVSFTDQSTNNPTSWSWSFQGGSPSSSTQKNPNITYNSPGTYNVSLTVSNAYGNNNTTKSGYITVTQGSSGTGFSLDFEEAANFQVDNFDPWTTYDGDQSNTYGVQDFDFTNEGYTGSFIAFNHALTSPVGSESWQAHGGQRSGICFAAQDGPNNDWLISPKITMASNGKITFWAKSITASYGLERFKVLVSTTNNNISSFTKISSGTYVEPPTDWTKYEYSLSSYNGQDIYVAIQCVSDDAFAFMIDDIEIDAGTQSGSAPVAQFTGSPTTINVGGTVNFTDQSTNNPTSWSWSFQGGSPSSSSQKNPSVVYNSPGTYNVSLTVTNAYGNNSITKNGYIIVNEQTGNAPVAQFTGSPTTINAGGTVNFTDQSTNNPTSWSWSFQGGSPSSSTQKNPSVVYNSPGTYNVSLTVTNAYGNNSITKNGYIIVNEQTGNTPVAQFTGNPTTLEVGGTVNFTDQSTNNPTSWSWSFQGGTPSSSTQKNPSVVYNSPGTYNVSLTVTNAHGNNSVTRNEYITVNQPAGNAPVANFSASSTWITVGESVNFTDQSTNSPTSWAWDFQGGTPSTSTSKNPTVTYNTVGTFNVKLTASNEFGSGTKTRNAYIRVVPPVTSFSLDFEDCSNFQVDNFSPWLTNDVDGLPSLNNTGTEYLNQNYVGSFIAYNHNETDPVSGDEYAPHGGERCGICMPVNGANNDWLISPEVSLGYEGIFSFWAKSVSANGLAEFKVLVNEYSTHPATFVAISGYSSIVAPNEWTLYTYNLDQYRGKTVHVAIQCTGSGHYGLMLDDIELISATSIDVDIAPNITLYPNPNEGNFVIDLGDYYADVDISVMSLNGQIIKVDTYKSGNMLNVNMENIANGMYFVRLTNESFTKTFKVNIQK
ncbi:MAG: PKD domain-containing protein [Bacteroidales bacterium]|nr:PKD domain-containing protein [Bacteroidales bacterium]